MTRWAKEVTDADVLNYIRIFQSAEGYAPTLREIAQGVGLAAQTAVLNHVRRLEASGALRRRRGSGRTIVVVGE
jgi:repressor LexA